MSPLFSSGYIESPTMRSPPSHLGISVGLHHLDDRLAILVCKQRNKASDGLHVIYRYLLAVNQTIGSLFENLIYGNIGDILLESFLSFRVFGICP